LTVAVLIALLLLPMFMFIQVKIWFEYIGFATAKFDVNITDATLYIQPNDSKLNITLTLTIHNHATYPVNVTSIYIDVNETCTYIFPMPYMPMVRRKKCLTQLDTPTVTVMPNETKTITAHKIHDKRVSATEPTTVVVTLSTVIPPFNFKTYQQITALANVSSNPT